MVRFSHKSQAQKRLLPAPVSKETLPKKRKRDKAVSTDGALDLKGEACAVPCSRPDEGQAAKGPAVVCFAFLFLALHMNSTDTVSVLELPFYFWVHAHGRSCNMHRGSMDFL